MEDCISFQAPTAACITDKAHHCHSPSPFLFGEACLLLDFPDLFSYPVLHLLSKPFTLITSVIVPSLFLNLST